MKQMELGFIEPEEETHPPTKIFDDLFRDKETGDIWQYGEIVVRGNIRDGEEKP